MGNLLEGVGQGNLKYIEEDNEKEVFPREGVVSETTKVGSPGHSSSITTFPESSLSINQQGNYVIKSQVYISFMCGGAEISQYCRALVRVSGSDMIKGIFSNPR